MRGSLLNENTFKKTVAKGFYCQGPLLLRVMTALINFDDTDMSGMIPKSFVFHEQGLMI